MKPRRPLTDAEERAERALYLAEHPVSYCNCGAGYIFCLHDRPDCQVKSDTIAVIIDQLIDRGRVET